MLKVRTRLALDADEVSAIEIDDSRDAWKASIDGGESAPFALLPIEIRAQVDEDLRQMVPIDKLCLAMCLTNDFAVRRDILLVLLDRLRQ